MTGYPLFHPSVCAQVRQRITSGGIHFAAMRLLCSLAVLLSTASLAQSLDEKLEAHRKKVADERHRLGLDKNDKAFGTPEVSFVGAAVGDGVKAVLCPGEAKAVTLKGAVPRSLVLPTSDDVSVTKEAFAGKGWTGTLLAKKGAAPRLFGLRGVLGSTAQGFEEGSFLVGCKQTLTFEVEGATMVLAVDLRQRSQTVKGEWKKGGEVVSARRYELSVDEGGVWLRSKPTPEEQQAQLVALQQVLESPKQAGLMKKQEALQRRMGECSKLPAGAQLVACFKPLEVESRKLGEEGVAIQAEAEKAGSPAAGCLTLHALVAQDSVGTECSGHRLQEEVRFTWKWSS